MILLTRMNGTHYYLNPDLIQTVESTPDTVITLVSNIKLIVKESPPEIVERCIEYRRKTLAPFASDDLLHRPDAFATGSKSPGK